MARSTYTTEKPFENAYWDNHEDGIYVDIVSGQPLFSSLDKYDSGTGWPSFTQPIEGASLSFVPDTTLGVQRTEVRSGLADSHLGHVFDDGPEPTGTRFCMNSAALRFVPLDQLKEQGLGRFLFFFAERKKWQVATLAGGCFWGVEELLRQKPGVIETQTGYSGGVDRSVGYEQVKTGKTGHAESVQILFDSAKLSYEGLLFFFFKLHDPTQLNHQGNDIGTQYRSAIFYHDEMQKRVAEEVKNRVERSGKWGKPIVTEIKPFTVFVRAEEDHQKYLVKYPEGYTCHFVRDLEF